MKKYYYKLMAKGKSAYLLGRPIGRMRDVIYWSREKYVVAKSEEIARVMIREKLKKKWLGFKIIKEVELK